MPIRTFIAAITSLLLATTVASAQPFIEFHVQGGIDGEGKAPFGENIDGHVPVDIKFVIDASAPPIIVIGDDLYVYETVYADYVPDAGFGDMPILTGDRVATEFSVTPHLYHNLGSQSLALERASPWYLSITGMAGDFSDASSSLPDDPDAYLLDVAGSNPSMYVQTDLPRIGILWTPDQGFLGIGGQIDSGGFHIRVRTVDDPRIPECIADLNGDGMLDFLDISDYLLAYTSGCEEEME